MEKNKIKETGNVVDNLYIRTCPICNERRFITYNSNTAIKNGTSNGYCTICSRLKMAQAKFDSSRIKSKKIKCFACNKDIPMSKHFYNSFIKSSELSEFVCFQCLINRRMALREENKLAEIQPYIGSKVFFKDQDNNTLLLHGCILTKQKKSSNTIFVSKRCNLGWKCKYFIDCLSKVSKLKWPGFTAVGKGHVVIGD